MAGSTRFELATSGLTVQCANQAAPRARIETALGYTTPCPVATGRWAWASASRTPRGQSVSVDMRAAVAAFRSERYLRVDGQVPPDPRGEIFGFYRAGDGRWIQLHGAMPHHRDGITSLLGCESTRAAAAAAVEKW